MSTPTYLHTTPGEPRGLLRLLQLYPRDMNIYGDWGNALTLARRAQWQGYDVELLAYNPGDPFPENAHLIVGGGGQDSGQERIKADLLERGSALRDWAAGGMPMLVICGLYQLFGHRFITASGGEIPGISIIDAETRGSSTRLIGNIVTRSEVFGELIGYENHSGLTHLGSGAKPLGQVLSGAGNNGEDGTEGARVGSVIGTYLHGSLLPKNPVLADWLLEQAVTFAGGQWDPAPLTLPAGLPEASRLAEWTTQARRVARSRPR